MTLVWRPGYGGAAVSDPDAMAYLRAVEEADNQALEQGVQQAVNQFVIGCKADGIWDAIKASCILAGARTLSGALVPLVGAAPTNYNFLSGDYDRKTGLVGDGSTKYLDSNRNNNADPQNNHHLSAYLSSSGNILGATFQSYISAHTGSNGSEIARSGSSPANVVAACHSGLGGAISAGGSTGFYGASRSTSSQHIFRVNGSNNTLTVSSSTPINQNTLVFARPLPSTSGYSNARISFYSIGEALDLALLDARVTDLMTAIGAAIP